MNKFPHTEEYKGWLKEIKRKIRRAQVTAALAANRKLCFSPFPKSEAIVPQAGAQIASSLARQLRGRMNVTIEKGK